MEEIRASGTPKRWQEAKMKKRGGPLISGVALGAILSEKWSPRWSPKSIKINTKRSSKIIIKSISFRIRILWIFWIFGGCGFFSRYEFDIEFSFELLDFVRNYALNHKIDAFDTFEKTGFFRHLVIRKAYHTNDLMVNLVCYYDDQDIINEIKETDYFFVICGWFFDETAAKKSKFVIESLGLNPDQFFIGIYVADLLEEPTEIKPIWTKKIGHF